jgi:hypothetical protein
MTKYRKFGVAALVAAGLTVAWLAGGDVSSEAVGAAWVAALAVFQVRNA